MRYPKLLGSSVDPEKLALTVKGLLGGVATLILFYAKVKGVALTDGELQNIINAVGDIIVYGGALISSLAFLAGLFRKAYNLVKDIIAKFKK